MAPTKKEAIEQLEGPNTVTHQQALVQKIRGARKTGPKKYVIPGGKEMHVTLPTERMEVALNNWLRHHRHFTEVMFSYASNPEEWKTKEAKALDFNTDHKLPQWELEGKKWLAEQMASVLNNTNNLIAVKVTRDGIRTYVDSTKDFSPDSEKWEPYIEITPLKMGEY